MDVGHGVTGVVVQPDHYFWHLLKVSALAEREGRPPPFP